MDTSEFGAHSVRGASTTAALKNGVGWTSSCRQQTGVKTPPSDGSITDQLKPLQPWSLEKQC